MKMWPLSEEENDMLYQTSFEEVVLHRTLRKRVVI